VVRTFVGGPIVPENPEHLLAGNGFTPATEVTALESTGYLGRDRTDNDGDTWFITTIKGNSLAMASFGKPISRNTADCLAAGPVERARSYNAGPGDRCSLNASGYLAATWTP
jgi:hypothetical protein